MMFQRRLPERFGNPVEAADVAYSFLQLVAGGPANIVAWGVSLTDAQVERQTRTNVRLFLPGVLH